MPAVAATVAVPRAASLAGLAAVALLLAGCDAGPPQAAVDAEPLACPTSSDCYDEVRAIGPGGAATIEGGDFFFEIHEATAVQGEIAVTFENTGGTFHNIVFIGDTLNEGPALEAQGGETVEGTTALFPGPVTFFCSVPGHRDQGMEGEMTVYADEAAAEAAATESPAPAGDSG